MQFQHHLRLFGQVQGVGLRYTVKNQALRMGLHGYVRNLTDGSVEIVIDDQLVGFTTWLKSEFGEKYVQKIEISQQKWEKFADFKILY